MAVIQQIVEWYENLNPDTLKLVSRFYSENARFKDPFNDVVGVKHIQTIFEHMFRTTENPRFFVKEQIQAEHQAFLTWEFRFTLNGKTYEIQGASHLRFDDEDKVIDHRDYWDPAEELWQKIPLLGGVIGWLRGKFKAIAD